MYLRECLIENVGPITALDVSLNLNDAGNPIPLILVGKNGTGKTIFLAYVLDALTELAKKKFRDTVKGQHNLGFSPFLKISSGGDIRSLSGSGLCLLEFSDTHNKFCYVENIGQFKLQNQDYVTKLRGRFESVQSYSANQPSYKLATGDDEQIETFFQHGAVCFFPSSRHERPHWLNLDAVEDKPLFSSKSRMSGILGKPLIVERAAEDNRLWLMDVFLDSLVDGDFTETLPNREGTQSFQWHLRSNLQDKWFLKKGRQNVELLLRSVLEDENAQLILNYRNSIHGRIAIRLGNGVVIPSLDHLSAGQSLLFSMFATIVRYAEQTDLQKSINLSEINGVVLIDEIDAHLHADLQYEVLPRLVKLFPKVQFIITSHAPLFLLGMEREFGADGIQILEMPDGKQITTERFEEFKKSFDVYRQTKSFEDTVEAQVLAASKPLILTEGHTDVAYIKTALKLLGHTDLIEQVEIAEVGQTGKGGTQGGGHTGLDAAYRFLENNQGHFQRRVLFLYDCDTKKIDKDSGSLSIRCIPKNDQNTKVPNGIENLLPVELFEERFYKKNQISKGYGEDWVISEFQKQEFCDWVCRQRKEKDDFMQFDNLVVPILLEFSSKQS